MSEQSKDQNDIQYVSSKTDKIMCDGGNEELGHPAVYFNIDTTQEVVCNSCNKKFIRKD